MDYAELVKLTKSNNDQERKAAEAKIQESKDANPGMFMLVAAREVCNPNQDPHIRITSAALIKRMIIDAQPGGQSVWIKIDNDTRKQIKEFILASLASNEHGVKNLAANLVAEITAIELPLGEWRELIPQLAQKTSDQQVEVRKAAIMTLGEIAEKLKRRPDILDDTLTENILTGICLGLQSNESNIQIREYSIKALHESLLFVRSFFEKEEMFKYVVIGVLENCIFQDRNVRVQALRCAIDLCEYYYVKVSNYAELLWKATGKWIRNSDSELAILSIEVWNTIASIDGERRLGVGESGKSMVFPNEQTLNITAKVSQNLIPYLIENLLEEDSFEKDDGGELSVGLASFRTLCSVSEAIGDLYPDFVLLFVSNHLSHENWINRRAAVLVFNSMVEGPSKEKIVGLINSAIVTLAGKIADSKVKVAEAIAICLVKIAEIHPECYFLNQTALKILPILLQGLEAVPRVSSHIAETWSRLIETHPKIENYGLNLDSIIEALLRNAFRTDITSADYSLIDYSLMTVMRLIHCCKNNQTVQKFLIIFITELQQSLTLTGGRGKFIQSGLLSCIQNALLNSESPDDTLTEKSYLLIVELFKLKGDVTPEGIHVLSACAAAMKTGFSRHMEETWKILSHSLQRTNESELFSACIGALVELSRACPDQFSQVLSQVIPLLISKLNDSSFDRFLKLSIFTAIGDMVLGCSKLIANYLPDILKIYDKALEDGIKSPQELTTELNEYVEQLRGVFIESFTCFIQGVEGSDKEAELFNYLPKVIQFLQATCNKTYNPTTDYLRNALALLADVGNFFGKESKQIINKQFTQDLISILRKVQVTEDQKNHEFIVNYADDVFKQLYS